MVVQEERHCHQREFLPPCLLAGIGGAGMQQEAGKGRRESPVSIR